MFDVIIIGGGAAGLGIGSLISMSNKDIAIGIIEKKEILGKKLAATGNGRCNISNQNCTNFLETQKFLKDIGIELTVEAEGRCYPLSNKAKDVVAAFVQHLEGENTKIYTNETVQEVTTLNNVFKVTTNKREYTGKNLVIATGGKAGPDFGTTGDGYNWAKNFGHTVNKVSPVLTGIDGQISEDLNGTRCKGEVRLYKKGELVFTESGEIQFTKTGVSGICVFNASRFLKLDSEHKFNDYTIKLNLIPELSQAELKGILLARCKKDGISKKSILLTIVSENVAKYVLTQELKSIKGLAKDITVAELDGIISKLYELEMVVTGAGGWKNAQCTAGGIAIEEVEISTSESKVVKGLYFAGEIVDYDGPCGGFNLQNVWETAMKVGENICIEYTK